jgi:hypothetical protein
MEAPAVRSDGKCVAADYGAGGRERKLGAGRPTALVAARKREATGTGLLALYTKKNKTDESNHARCRLSSAWFDSVSLFCFRVPI